jgi:hypothetical protein
VNELGTPGPVVDQSPPSLDSEQAAMFDAAQEAILEVRTVYIVLIDAESRRACPDSELLQKWDRGLAAAAARARSLHPNTDDLAAVRAEFVASAHELRQWLR